MIFLQAPFLIGSNISQENQEDIVTHGGDRSYYSTAKISFIVLTGANFDSVGSYCYGEDILSSDSLLPN